MYGPSVFLFTSSTHLATLYSLLYHGFKYLQKALVGSKKVEEEEEEEEKRSEVIAKLSKVLSSPKCK